jgi:hypothetical protein
MSVEQLEQWELAGEREALGGNLHSATLSTTNPTWPELGSNPGRSGGKPATNRLSYGTALPWVLDYTEFNTVPNKPYIRKRVKYVHVGFMSLT